MDVSLDCLAKNIGSVSSLESVPEDLVLSLFQRVLQQGRLTPKSLDLFSSSGHAAIGELVVALKIQRWIPPMPIGSGDMWLGDKSHLW